MPLSYQNSQHAPSKKPRLRTQRLITLAVLLWVGFLGAVAAFTASLWVTRLHSLSLSSLTLLFLVQWFGASLAAAGAWTLATTTPKASNREA